MTDKLVQWLIFSAAFAAFVPAVQVPLLYTHGSPVSLDALFGQGELLMVVVGICLSAVGELMSIGRRHHKAPQDRNLRVHLRTFFLGLNLLVALVASAWYGNVTRPGSRLAFDVRRRIVTGSVWLFAFGLACGAIGVAISGEEER